MISYFVNVSEYRMCGNNRDVKYFVVTLSSKNANLQEMLYHLLY